MKRTTKHTSIAAQSKYIATLHSPARASGTLVVQVEQVERHRNGVSGEPFWALRADWYDVDANGHKGEQHSGIIVVADAAVALYGERKNGNEVAAWWEHVYVVVPTDLTSKWRGDNFGEAVVPWLWKRDHEAGECR